MVISNTAKTGLVLFLAHVALVQASINSAPETIPLPGVDPAPAIALAPVSHDDRIKILQADLSRLDEQLAQMKNLVSTKTKAYHELSQSQAKPLYIWEEPSETSQKKSLILKIASLDLKQLLKKAEAFQAHRDEMSFELEWLGMEIEKIETAEVQPLAKASSKKSTHVSTVLARTGNFACDATPVEALDGEKAQIVQGFGETRDPESGIHWQSSGWWVQRLKADVHACAPGKVAFSGKIPGRGGVVLIDHGQGVISLYANLSDGDLPQRGARMETGSLIGYLKDKFYFEIRRDGLAIDPKTIFSPERLAKFVAK